MKVFLLSIAIIFSTQLFSQTEDFEKQVVKKACTCVKATSKTKLDSCVSRSFAQQVIENDKMMPYLNMDAMKEGIGRITAKVSKKCKIK